jgi:hypothetical protein
MATANLRETFDRIKSASEKSQIAVFRTEDPKLFRSVFAASSSFIHHDLWACKKDHLGTFHGPYGAAEFKRMAVY